MDEVLVKNEVNETMFSKKAAGLILCLMLFAFAVVMILVGVSHFMEMKILSGVFYSLMGVTDLALIGACRRGDF